MYLPRLRRISDVIKEMRAQDEDTVITRHIIEELIHKRELSALKYGDAWIVNLDELYLYMCAQKDIFLPRTEEQYTINRTMWTTGEIYRAFLAEDPNTIVRKPNMRRFVASNNIKYGINERGKWIINVHDFVKTVNPKNLSFHIEMPRIRWHDDTVRNFQKRNPNIRIPMREIEEILRTDQVFTALNGRRWYLNYDELEQEIFKRKHKLTRNLPH